MRDPAVSVNRPCRTGRPGLRSEKDGGVRVTIRQTVAVISTLIFISGSVWAQSGVSASGKAIPGLRFNGDHAGRRDHRGGHLTSPNFRRSYPGQRYGFGSGFSYSPYFAQSYGWQGFNYRAPYSYSPYTSYLYFYDLYDQEAQRSKQDADEFEASLERQGKLTGPAKVGAFPSDFLPLPSRGVTTTLDGKVQNPSPRGDALVIGSGRHTLRITAR